MLRPTRLRRPSTHCLTTSLLTGCLLQARHQHHRFRSFVPPATKPCRASSSGSPVRPRQPPLRSGLPQLLSKQSRLRTSGKEYIVELMGLKLPPPGLSIELPLSGLSLVVSVCLTVHLPIGRWMGLVAHAGFAYDGESL
ncbi:uncharacterized protein BDZ99DRAFT_577749 [Mytilinidion resinicola]|uniref:Uncharacterized protein n=1 Tax=Mytilinidion resinicola TaxID=574789 RepID=A0A6A6XZT6_9PEZI|nr:uncharacterized protein BDZ99DRAFT_577749 [Mytilinidion resinicola]KAF2801254.1 hypothetical protein BDZ99DRAFT_577749 [Mytilinidion resinicola]